MENFAERPEFPIENREAYDQFLRRLGQKPVYRALVDTYGREMAVEGLARFVPRDLARMQIDVLVPPEVPVSPEMQTKS